MEKKIASLMVVALLCGSGIGRADFKYTESAKITGGMMAGMMKFAGAFNKQAGQPMITTHYLKGSRMRIEQSAGKVQIVDLDGRRFIDIDPQKQTYSVLTFDEMRAALEKMQENMNQKGAKMVPKFEVTPTKNTKVLMGQPTREVKVRIEMQVQSENPNQQQAQNVSFLVSSDMWVASTVQGYQEIQKFHERMAKELNWVPGASFGANPQMARAMLELQKGGAALNGLPLLQYASMGMTGMPQPSAGGAQSQGQKESQASQAQTTQSEPGKSANSEETSQTITSPRDALAKGLGGVLGGFGKKKKKQETEQTSIGSSTSTPPPGQAGSGSGSLADMTIEVTSFSSDPLDAALFEVPVGFRQVEASADEVLGNRRR